MSEQLGWGTSSAESELKQGTGLGSRMAVLGQGLELGWRAPVQIWVGF